MRILVVGGGGREHALVWQLAKSAEVEKIFCAPGNAGIAALAECVPIDPAEIFKLRDFARGKGIDLTVVGPEAPLVGGIADLFRDADLHIFGPGGSGARLEGSKVWAKAFMKKYGIPSAAYAVFHDAAAAMDYLDEIEYPVVVKADGLAAGKGVVVAADRASAHTAVQQLMVQKIFGQAGAQIVVEECLQGEEISLFVLTDGNTMIMLPSAQDHKAVFEGDRGPNTGGMGAYSPAGILTPKLLSEAKERVFAHVLQGLRAERIEYNGVLYAGCMLTAEGLKVLEFNVRFGDPETQVVMPRLSSPLPPLLMQTARGELAALEPPRWSADAAVCVVMASNGYPGNYETGKEIYGLEKARAEKGVVFHGGTAFKDGKIVSSGGRVLGVTAWGADLRTAQQQAYLLAGTINFEGAYCRRDIGYRAL
ncbi:MAG TPA: phosphoribosylamine--glycine ligase [Firmicutes bacterium]|nr:phosphoribosylamine--glycine ligase [Bacillota bacterium]